MDLIASEVMRRTIRTVPKTLPLPSLQQAFLEFGVSGFPVVEGQMLVGVVSHSDVIRRLSAEQQVAAQTSDFYRDSEGFHEIPMASAAQVSERVGQQMKELTVAEVMHPRLYAVGADQTLREVAQTMIDNDIHRVLVTRQGRLLGLISTLDIVKLVAQGRLKPV